jgi:hypothetical protein
MSQRSAPIFFPVSLLKLFVMFIVTFGFYGIFWFYQNWKLIKAKNESDIIPLARAIFSNIFFYPLIKEIKNSANSIGTAANYDPLLLTVLWIALSISVRLPDPYWLVCYLSVLVLLPLQKVVNELNVRVAPEHNPNSHFSTWNIVGVVFGGILFLLAIVGSFLPDTTS